MLLLALSGLSTLAVLLGLARVWWGVREMRRRRARGWRQWAAYTKGLPALLIARWPKDAR